MEEKIKEICYDLETGCIDWVEASKQLLALTDVVVGRVTLSCDCPVCGKEMTSQMVKHHHCEKCKEHYTTT